MAPPSNVQVPETVMANLLPNHQSLSTSASSPARRVVRTFHGKQEMASLFGVNSNTAATNIQHFANK